MISTNLKKLRLKNENFSILGGGNWGNNQGGYGNNMGGSNNQWNDDDFGGGYQQGYGGGPVRNNFNQGGRSQPYGEFNFNILARFIEKYIQSLNLKYKSSHK